MIKKTSSKNTEGLKKFAKKKNLETIEKVNLVLDRLKRSKTVSINFKTVAEEAGVSKATLYNNDILKERIMSLRSIKKNETVENTGVSPKSKMQEKDERIKRLYEEINRLKEDKQNLIYHLVEMEEIKIENKRLMERLKN